MYEQKLRKEFEPFVDHIIIMRGRSGVWDVVEFIMKFLWKHHKREMQDIIGYVKGERGKQLDQFGSAGKQNKLGLRRLGSAPERLEQLLRRAYEGEMPIPEKKFKREFFKRYPEFKIAEKI